LFVCSFVCFVNHAGMFWRGDPATKAPPPSSDNWPRNGALLEGEGPVVVEGEEYFKVSAIQQAGTKEFTPVAEGTFMLYNQGGKVLHETE
jgi:hypothetical protein